HPRTTKSYRRSSFGRASVHASTEGPAQSTSRAARSGANHHRSASDRPEDLELMLGSPRPDTFRSTQRVTLYRSSPHFGKRTSFHRPCSRLTKALAGASPTRDASFRLTEPVAARDGPRPANRRHPPNFVTSLS